ncbi:efflux RND transporter periplasmic adaptor subunit [uncultured Pseudoteredinibacter sp.]|uniref:efflux RND transporter periplasmic adaptor subunit n=1 Tax=uncultured Pseudoteredinibacter sp. TaxID=1641701 RepID=UPI002608A2E3|nr:efflux RND transporter periplasmic adaptor subunit [uncultured Pseudoteredinibacter sp.]
MKQQRFIHYLANKQQLSKVLTFCLLGVSTIANFTNAQSLDKPVVQTAKVEAWPAGLSKTLYCVVSTPQLFQSNSQSSSELLTILPIGAQVKAGELVALQDDFYLRQDLKQLKIDEQLAQAELAHARGEYQRLAVLSQKDMISKAQLSEAALIQTRAKLQLESLNNKTRTLERRIESLEHRAPFRAQVLRVDAEPGQQLSTGQSLFQLLPLEYKQLECKLPLDIAKELKLLGRQSFHYTQAQSSSFSAADLQFSVSYESGYTVGPNEESSKLLSLRALSHKADKDTQSLDIYLELQNPQHPRLLIGQRVKVKVQQQHADISRVPYDAISLSGNSYELWQLKDDNSVSKIYPHIVSTSKNHFIIRSPLRAGDKVITRGQRELKEKQLVFVAGEPT